MLTLAIPNRNGAQFLEHTLVSLERNRPHVRWWLQDSCSSDDSVAIAKRYLTPADHIEVEADGSQAEGLNRAVRRMGGDIIGFLNSDDCLADGAAEAVLDAFAADPDLDIVYGRVEWNDAEGQSRGFHQGDISSLLEVLDIYGVWWNRRNWVQPEVFWRRSLWDRVGQFNDRFDLAFDYEYWVRCFESGIKVRKVPQVLARFRLHSAQKSSNSAKAAREIRAVVSRSLSTNSSLGYRRTFRLRNQLAYDLYHSGEDGASHLEFWRALATHPGWLSVPVVRMRLRNSRTWRIFSPRRNEAPF
jgi:glycosyltransferase involved in cell wall biosynthesis